MNQVHERWFRIVEARDNQKRKWREIAEEFGIGIERTRQIYRHAKAVFRHKGASVPAPGTLQSLELPSRQYNSLARSGVETVSDALFVLDEFLSGKIPKIKVGDFEIEVRNFGEKSYFILAEALSNHGYLTSNRFIEVLKILFKGKTK